MVDGDGSRETPKLQPPPPGPANANPAPPRVAQTPAQGVAAPAVGRPASAARAVPPRSTPTAVPAVGAPLQEQPAFLINLSVPWPRCVPGDAEAALALRGEPVPSQLRSVTEHTIAALSPVERAAIRGEPVLIENAAALRKALVCRWQLMAALALKPSALPQVDQAAAEAMLATVDSALANLRAITEAHPEMASALEQTRNTIASKAVTFSEALHAPVAEPGTPRGSDSGITKSKPPPAKQAGAPTKAAPLSPAAQRKRRMIALGVTLGLMALATVAFHLSAGSSAGKVERPEFPGAPAGLVLASPPKATPVVLMSISPTPIPADELERFRVQLESQGQTLQEAGSKLYRVVPKAGAAGPSGAK